MVSGFVRSAVALGLVMLMSGCVMPGPGTKAPAETEQVAEAAWSIGDYEEAARLYELAAARDGRSVEALIGLGKSYAALGQYSRAGNALARARDLDRRNPEVYNQLGNLALQEMHPKEAIVHFSDALRLDRRNLKAFTGKGVSLDYLSRHAEAHEVYQEGLRFYPTNFPLLSNYALSQVLGRQIGEGTRLMEELLRDPVNGDTVRANLAIAYALDGRVRDARAMLTGLMSDAEIDVSLRHYEAARLNYLAGKPVGYMIFQ